MLAGIVVLSGCERADPRLEHLTVGMGKDSALAVMQWQPTKLEPYLVAGQYIEGMFYARPGTTDSASRQPRKMTPVVLVNGKLIGWGWEVWDSMAVKYNIPVAPKKR